LVLFIASYIAGYIADYPFLSNLDLFLFIIHHADLLNWTKA